MEKLQKLLIDYNRTHKGFGLGWHRQFLSAPLPFYWRKVYELLSNIGRMNRIVEIGSGLGDVLACCCDLGFETAFGYERDLDVGTLAEQKISDIFGRAGTVIKADFRCRPVSCDVLLMVNCVYADGTQTKEEYCQLLRDFVLLAGNPRWMIYESVDAVSSGAHEVFPVHVRLSEADVYELFPDRHVQGWQTYRMPQNRTDKRLYLLERRAS